MPVLDYAARQPNLASRELDEARLDLLRRRVLVFAYVVGSLLILLTLLAQTLPGSQTRASRLARFSPDAAEASLDLAPHDWVFLYSDGLIEARDPIGRYFGIPALRAMLESAGDCSPGVILDTILVRIEQHRAGEASDDTLIAALSLQARDVADVRKGFRDGSGAQVTEVAPMTSEANHEGDR